MVDHKTLKDKLSNQLYPPLPFEGDELTGEEIKELWGILDRVEEGRCIDLPCKPGDPVFYVNGVKNLVEEFKVDRVIIELTNYDRWDLNLIYFVDKDTGKNLNGVSNFFYFKWIGDIVFFDKDKANKRLVELRSRYED